MPVFDSLQLNKCRGKICTFNFESLTKRIQTAANFTAVVASAEAYEKKSKE